MYYIPMTILSQDFIPSSNPSEYTDTGLKQDITSAVKTFIYTLFICYLQLIQSL
jgi:hypothetical protein